MIFQRKNQKKEEKSFLDSFREWITTPEWMKEMIGRSAYVVGNFFKDRMRAKSISSIEFCLLISPSE